MEKKIKAFDMFSIFMFILSVAAFAAEIALT